jgi:hypothetical protein
VVARIGSVVRLKFGVDGDPEATQPVDIGGTPERRHFKRCDALPTGKAEFVHRMTDATIENGRAGAIAARKGYVNMHFCLIDLRGAKRYGYVV